MQNINIVNDIPIVVYGNTSTYTGTNLAVSTTFIRNKSKCLLAVLIGPGGGGSSGWADVAGAATTPGGGGGGAGAYVVNFMPSYLLPSIIDIRIDGAGAGGAASRLASNPGGSAGRTALSTIRNLNSAAELSAAYGGDGATAATTSAGGGGGAIGSTGLNCIGITRSSANSITGVGAAGGTTGLGVSTRLTNDIPVCGGAGGGGITNTDVAIRGGNVTAAGIEPVYASVAGPTAVSITPSMLFSNFMPNTSSGGVGGGSSAGSAGADGAKGNYGSGGGGGGASNSAASNSGAGGNGGPGLAILLEI